MTQTSGDSKTAGFSQAESSTENKAAAAAASVEDRLAALEGDVAALLGSAGKANDAITHYAEDLQKDLKHTNRIKWAVLIYSGVYITTINLLLGYLIFYNKFYFITLGAYTRVSFILAAVSSSIGLFVAILRGAFKSNSDRHKENYTLSEIKTLAGIITPKNDS